MIHTKVVSDATRLASTKASMSHVNSPAMQPGHTTMPNAAQTAQIMAHGGKVAPRTSTSPNHIGTAPGTTHTKSTKPKDDKETTQSGTGKAAARREAHSNHPIVGPSAREGRSGGQSNHQGHQDMHDWMPFSAQQSRIARTPYMHRGPALAKVTAHPFHPLKSAVFSLAGRFYSEILPSVFRRTPQQADTANRQAKKEALRKSNDQRMDRNETRRNEIRARAEENPKRVWAGDVNRAFAGT